MVGLLPIVGVAGYTAGLVQEKVVARTDDRVKAITEVITGIKAIKFYAWEPAYLSRIRKLRRKELFTMCLEMGILLLDYVSFISAPVLIALGGFTAFVLMGGQLTASIAFPALVTVKSMTMPLFSLSDQVCHRSCVGRSGAAAYDLHGEMSHFGARRGTDLSVCNKRAPGFPRIIFHHATRSAMVVLGSARLRDRGCRCTEVPLHRKSPGSDAEWLPRSAAVSVASPVLKPARSVSRIILVAILLC